eukprot:TRINITY_DN15891_c0_g1_i1.p2 TRINITY_DN15891_c0_g1~~TRINITY_DN15891_c0_g1_i1.p2  ORF type:complete len:83 (-),score=5.87 TRINITY_DN15891_c0_g1_i1:206-454(-)
MKSILSTFKFIDSISIQQELKESSDITITTRDGVQMNVRGLLTYQVVDVDKLIHENRCVSNCTKIRTNCGSITCQHFLRDTI